MHPHTHTCTYSSEKERLQARTHMHTHAQMRALACVLSVRVRNLQKGKELAVGPHHVPNLQQHTHAHTRTRSESFSLSLSLSLSEKFIESKLAEKNLDAGWRRATAVPSWWQLAPLRTASTARPGYG